MPRPQQSPFEFLLRHVDDEPTIADYRFLHGAATGIIETTLGFSMVGEIEGATRLLETLKVRGLDPFEVLGPDYPFLKPCMYFAWEATASWPTWIPEAERTEKNLEELETQGRGPWLERFSEEWNVSEETAKKALEMAYQSLPTALPDFNGTLAGQVHQAELMWKNGEFSYAASPNGPMTIRYARPAMWWRQGIYPYPYARVHRTAGFMIAFDIYLRLGKDNEAQSVLERMCGRWQYEEQVEQLACSRIAWKKFLAVPERPILDFLEIHAAKLRQALSRALKMAEHRLENGPRRRYRNESIEKLAHAVSANTFHNCPYDVLAAYRPPDKPRARPENASGLLRPACSSSDIATLEQRLEITLLQDYKDFLSVTNGLESMWNGQNLMACLVRAEDVCWQDIDFLKGNRIPLLRQDDPTPSTDNRLDWPEIGGFRCVCLSGDQNREDTSHLFLLGRDVIQPYKNYFFRTYGERNDSQRRELDRVVEETYGSMETFRNLDYALVGWTSWDMTFYPYNGIRDLLERAAEAALYKDRPWLNIFEPRFRRLA
ncbi:hypothetical protein QQZ08_005341 [Neonectria magnoliae]|uniref:Knr4/Smi1-like domain-containing protein n=1 Tax=Neonectria magnoliae TaxID=2732573 RepID=A0ABR1I5D1_9HYPO